MSFSIVQLLPTLSFGTGAGPYDGVSPDFTGVPAKASSYYRRLYTGTQTVSYNLLNFDGEVIVMGTLVENPTETDWVSLHTIDAIGVPLTETSFVTLTGNYVWFRVSVNQFVAGNINQLDLTY